MGAPHSPIPEPPPPEPRGPARLLPARFLPWLIVTVLLATAAGDLLRVPRLGVADNGDFWRVARPAGVLVAADLGREPRGRRLQGRFPTGDADLASLPSSPAVLAWLARHGGRYAIPGVSAGEMDLRQLGLLYLLLTATLVVLAVVWRLPPLLVAGCLYVLADPGYLLFFNSFYAAPALLAALLGITFWLLRWGDPCKQKARDGPRGEADSGGGGVVSGRALAWTVLGALCLLGGAAKVQHSVLPAVVALTLLAAAGARRARPAGLVAGTAVLVVLAAALAGHFLWGPGPHFATANRYHAVYAGLARLSDEPEAALAGLGIPERWWRLPRRDVFAGGIDDAHPVHGALAEVSRLEIAAAYLAEPATWPKLTAALERELAARRSHRRATMEATDDGTPARRRTFRHPWDFSRLRGAVVGRAPVLLWVLAAAVALRLLWRARRRRWRGVDSAMLFLALWVVVQGAVAVLGDGLVSLRQHLLGARLAVDLLLVLLVYSVLAASGTALRRPPRRRPAADPPPADALPAFRP